MENDYSKMTSAELKELSRNVEVDPDLEDLIEVDLPDEEAGDDLDPEQEIAQLQAEHEESQIATMSPQARSAYKRAQKEVQSQKATEFGNLFAEDARELSAKYKDFPEELREFANAFSFGWLTSGLTEEQARTVENPEEELFLGFIADKAKQKGRIRHERVKEIFQTAVEGPKLRSRTRDRVFGYDKSEEKMSDEKISEIADSLFEE